jgi:dCTP deaminase
VKTGGERVKARCIFCKGPVVDRVCTACGLSQNERTLVDWEIKTLLNLGVITVEPILDLECQLGAASLDLRLDNVFREFRCTERGVIDLAEEIVEEQFYDLRVVEIDKGDLFYLHPGKFALAQTFEYVHVPQYILAELDGRSSIAKSGIEVHATASKISPGFSGHITFELKNPGEMAVKLRPLQRIGALTFHLTKKARKPYTGTFQYQIRIRPPRPDPDLVRIKDFLEKRKKT